MYGLGSEPPCPWHCRQRDDWSGRCRLRGEAREGREAIILSCHANESTTHATSLLCVPYISRDMTYVPPRTKCKSMHNAMVSNDAHLRSRQS